MELISIQGSQLTLDAHNFSIGAFSAVPQELIIVEGSSGSGKSNLIKALHGQLPLQQGLAWALDFDLLSIRPNSRAVLRRALGLVAPYFPLLPEYGLAEQIEIQLRLLGQFDDKQIAAQIQECLDFVELSAPPPIDKMNRMERAQALLARAIAHKPQLLLLDGLLDDFQADHLRGDCLFFLEKINAYVRQHYAAAVLTVNAYSELCSALANANIKVYSFEQNQLVQRHK